MSDDVVLQGVNGRGVCVCGVCAYISILFTEFRIFVWLLVTNCLTTYIG